MSFGVPSSSSNMAYVVLGGGGLTAAVVYVSVCYSLRNLQLWPNLQDRKGLEPAFFLMATRGRLTWLQHVQCRKKNHNKNKVVVFLILQLLLFCKCILIS